MNLKPILFTCLIGVAGGLVFHVLGLPMAWLLGPAFAVMIGNTIRPQAIEWPRPLGDAGIIVVAYVLGSTMHQDIVTRIFHDLPMMILSACVWIAACFMLGLLFAKVARIGVASSVLGNVPGGLSQMVSIADDFKGADAGIVAIMQTTRVITVLYTVPFFAAWVAHHQPPGSNPVQAVAETAQVAWPPYIAWLLMPLVPLSAVLLRRLRMPAGEFLGPVVLVGGLSVAGCAWPSVPDAMLSCAQLLIGLFIGRRVQLQMIISNKRLGPLALLSSCMLVLFAALAAWAITMFMPGTFITWFLALAPGGLGEVAVTAMTLNEDVAQVTAYQICRLLFVLLVAPQFIRWYLRRQSARSGAAESVHGAP